MASSLAPLRVNTNDQPRSICGSFQCKHICGCLYVLSNGGRGIYPSWDTCSKHIVNKISHPSCSDSCPGFPLLSTDPSQLSSSDFRRGQSDRATATCLTEIPDSDPGMSELEIPTSTVRATPLVEPSASPVLKKSTPSPEAIQGNLVRTNSQAIAENVVGDDATRIIPGLDVVALPNATSNTPKSSADMLNHVTENVTVPVKCAHTCRCLGRSKDPEPRRSFNSAFDARLHARNKNNHTRCGVTCPGYEYLEEAKKQKKGKEAHNLSISQKSAGTDPYPKPNPSEEDADDNSRETAYKCNHTCVCLGSPSAMYEFNSPSVFKSSSGAKRHITSSKKHPNCTSRCPAHLFSGSLTFKEAEPIVVYSTEPVSPLTEKFSDGGYPSKPQKHLSPYKLANLEPRARTPPHRRSNRTEVEVVIPTRPARKRPSNHLEGGSVNVPPPSKRHHGLPGNEVTRTFEYRNREPEKPDSELLLQHVSTLNGLYRQFSQLPTEFEVLSMGLRILPHTPSNKIYFAVPGSSPTLSARQVPTTLLSPLAHIITTLNSVSEALKRILQTQYETGLLEDQNTKLEVLRRRVAKLCEQTIDLQLYLQKVSKKDGVKGLIREEKRATKTITDISDGLDEAGVRMKKLMEATLDHL